MCQERCLNKLRQIAPGKISLGLYYNNQLTYGSWFGGVIQIIATMLIISYSAIVLYPVFDGSAKEYQFYYKNLNTTLDMNSIKIKDVISKFNNMFVVVRNVEKFDDNFCQNNITFLWSFYTFDLEMDKEYISNSNNYTKLAICQIKLKDFFLSQNDSILEGKAIKQEDYSLTLNSTFEIRVNDESTSISTIILEYYYSVITSDEITEKIGYLSVSSLQAIVTLSLQQLKQTSNIFGVFSTFESDLFVQDMFSFLQFGDSHQKSDIAFNLDSRIAISIQEPQNLFATLAKIGGMLGLAKILSFIMQLVHYIKFEKILKQIKRRNQNAHNRESVNLKISDEFANEYLINKDNVTTTQNDDTTTFETGTDVQTRESISIKKSDKEIRTFFSYKQFVKMNNHIREQAVVIGIQEDKIFDLQEELRVQRQLLTEIMGKINYNKEKFE